MEDMVGSHFFISLQFSSMDVSLEGLNGPLRGFLLQLRWIPSRALGVDGSAAKSNKPFAVEENLQECRAGIWATGDVVPSAT